MTLDVTTRKRTGAILILAGALSLLLGGLSVAFQWALPAIVFFSLVLVILTLAWWLL